jgi:SAM-dependent methyltransferase
MSATITPTPDYAAIRQRQKGAWGTGNYAIIGTTLQLVGEQLCEALDLRHGARVLDVAAGNGNATLAAARRGAVVTSTDFVPALLEAGRRRAHAEGATVTFQEADAEALPFADGAFDVVLSTFGVMFTPDQAQAARELLRVTRDGGQVGLANWTPDGFIGQLFTLIGQYVPPVAGLRPPSRWGTHEGLRELFGSRCAIHATERHFTFRYASPAQWVDTFRAWYGPMARTFQALEGDPARLAAFERDLLALLARFNRATDGTLVGPSTYLEVVVTKGR